MNDATSTSLLADARQEIQQVREWLLRPGADSMSACVPALEHAVSCVRRVTCREIATGPGLSAAAERLAAEVCAARALLAAAGSLYFTSLRRSISAPEPDVESPSGTLSALG